MASNILLLPVVQVCGGVETDEDLLFSIAFLASDGVTPISLAGITFTSTISYFAGDPLFVGSSVATEEQAATLFINNNTILFWIPVSLKQGWEVGAYEIDLLASDGTYASELFGPKSTLVIGHASVWTLVVLTPAFSVASLYPSQLASLIAAVFPTPQSITTSMTLPPGPGLWVVKVTGLTVTLSSNLSVPGPVTIVDGTGSPSPGISIDGPGISLGLGQGQSLTFYPDPADAEYLTT